MSTVRPEKTITWVQTVLIYLSGKVVISETFLSSHPLTLQSHEKAKNTISLLVVMLKANPETCNEMSDCVCD